MCRASARARTHAGPGGGTGTASGFLACLQRLVAVGRNGEERGGNQGGKGKGSAFLSLRDINAAGAEKRSARKHCSNPAVTEIIQDMIQWAPPHLAVHRGRQDITARSPGTLTHRDGAS